MELLFNIVNMTMYKILSFGDSIIFGRGVAKSKSYISRLANFFDAVDRYGFLVFNLGVPGESSQELLERLEEECMVRLESTLNSEVIILIAIGINDAKFVDNLNNFKTPIEIFSKNIDAIINLLRRYTKNILFVGLTPVNESQTNHGGASFFLNSNIKKYNDIIRDVCAEKNVYFVEIFNKWISDNYLNLLAEDGIHLNEFGHRKIFNEIEPLVSSFLPQSEDFVGSGDSKKFSLLQKMYSLSQEDIEIIKSRFQGIEAVGGDIFLGQFKNEKPTLIIGAPCVRKDIEGISFNTFYQVFMPIFVASKLKLPCKIFLGIKEEIILQENLHNNYEELGLYIESAITNMANDLNVEIEVINTLLPKNDDLIKKYVKDLNIHISQIDSTYLFSLSFVKTDKPLHSLLRASATTRVIACNTYFVLQKFFGRHNFLIVEDIEESTCILFAHKFDAKKSPNLLAFLPLPSISGKSVMFKAIKKDRLFLGKKKNYYLSAYKKMPAWVKNIYGNILRIIMKKDRAIKINDSAEYSDFESFLELVDKASGYFK